MKVENVSPIPWPEDPQSLTTQSETVPPNTSILRRPVPNRATSISSLQDTAAWDEKSEHETLLSTTGESEQSSHDPDTGLSTPTHLSEYQSLPIEEARCSLLPNRSAAWLLHGKDLRLSALAAAVLLHENKIKTKDLDLFHSLNTRDDPPEPTDPISGVLSAAHGTIGGVVNGLADYPIEITKMLKEDRPLATGMAVDFALDRGKGVSRIVGTGLKAPMDITMGLAKGFHNMPKAFGDETVREKEKVTGFGSGLKVAGKGLGLGLYDGITGLVTQPVRGAQEGGAFGFLGGLGKGIAGVVCKPAAGACGVPAYAFKGIYEEMHKNRGFDVDEHVVAALTAQGENEWNASTNEEKKDILWRWEAIHTRTPSFLQEKYQ